MNKITISVLVILAILLLYLCYPKKEGYKPSDAGYGLPYVAVPSFEKHIKLLFRPYDVVSMKWKFDLHKYEDVKIYAEPIYRVLKSKTMPCDKPWPDDNIALFKKWMDTGYNP